MAEIRELRRADGRVQRWKNGLGTTRELALWPAGAELARGDFEWRIARASIEAPGPFSEFAGCDRVLVVVEGGDLELLHGAHAPRRRLHPFEPYAFPGEWATSAALPHGPVQDVNVLARRDAWRASVQALELGPRRALEELTPGHAFVLAIEGELVVRVCGEEEPRALPTGDSLWACELARPTEVELCGAAEGCRVLVVRLERA